MTYLRQIWLAIDQFLNTLFGGQADETISSRCWRCRGRQPFAAMVRIINFIIFWQNNHCRGAYAQFVQRKSTQIEQPL